MDKKLNKFVIAIALLVMLAIAFYFSQSRPAPQIESLEGLDSELEALIEE